MSPLNFKLMVKYSSIFFMSFDICSTSYYLMVYFVLFNDVPSVFLQSCL